MKMWRRGAKKDNGATDADPLALVESGAKLPDELSAREMAEVDDELEQGIAPAAIQGLVALVEPPPDLSSRLARGVDKQLLGRQTAMMCFDLLTTGWHTTRVVMSPEEDD